MSCSYGSKIKVQLPPNKSLRWPTGFSHAFCSENKRALRSVASELNRYAVKLPSQGMAPEMTYKGLLSQPILDVQNLLPTRFQRRLLARELHFLTTALMGELTTHPQWSLGQTRHHNFMSGQRFDKTKTL